MIYRMHTKKWTDRQLVVFSHWEWCSLKQMVQWTNGGGSTFLAPQQTEYGDSFQASQVITATRRAHGLRHTPSMGLRYQNITQTLSALNRNEQDTTVVLLLPSRCMGPLGNHQPTSDTKLLSCEWPTQHVTKPQNRQSRGGVLSAFELWQQQKPLVLYMALQCCNLCFPFRSICNDELLSTFCFHNSQASSTYLLWSLMTSHFSTWNST